MTDAQPELVALAIRRRSSWAAAIVSGSIDLAYVACAESMQLPDAALIKAILSTVQKTLIYPVLISA